MTRLVNIWSGPRNVSTALLYAFRERADTTVVDEPLYAAFLARNPDVDHPGRDDVLASQPTDPAEVVARLLGEDWPTPVVVAKQMAAHLDGLDRAWLDDAAANVVLVRAPEPVVASYTEQVSGAPVARMGAGLVDALGYPGQAWLIDRSLSRGERPLVLETQRLLDDPAGVLARLCELLDLPFDDAMLSWEAGPKPQDGVWAPHWYQRTHESTGFGRPRRRDVDLPDHLAEVAATARPLYDRIAAHAL
jgi:hypothetical protein